MKRVGAMDSLLVAFSPSPTEPSLGETEQVTLHFYANILYQFRSYNSPFTATLNLPEHEHFPPGLLNLETQTHDAVGLFVYLFLFFHLSGFCHCHHLRFHPTPYVSICIQPEWNHAWLHQSHPLILQCQPAQGWDTARKLPVCTGGFILQVKYL